MLVSTGRAIECAAMQIEQCRSERASSGVMVRGLKNRDGGESNNPGP
jgi:hypothetical protein